MSIHKQKRENPNRTDHSQSSSCNKTKQMSREKIKERSNKLISMARRMNGMLYYKERFSYNICNVYNIRRITPIIGKKKLIKREGSIV